MPFDGKHAGEEVVAGVLCFDHPGRIAQRDEKTDVLLHSGAVRADAQPGVQNIDVHNDEKSAVNLARSQEEGKRVGTLPDARCQLTFFCRDAIDVSLSLAMTSVE